MAQPRARPAVSPVLVWPPEAAPVWGWGVIISSSSGKVNLVPEVVGCLMSHWMKKMCVCARRSQKDDTHWHEVPLREASEQGCWIVGETFSFLFIVLVLSCYVTNCLQTWQLKTTNIYDPPQFLWDRNAGMAQLIGSGSEFLIRLQ